MLRKKRPRKRRPSPGPTRLEGRAMAQSRWPGDTEAQETNRHSMPRTPPRGCNQEARQGSVTADTTQRTRRTRGEGNRNAGNRQPVVVLPGGGTREIERRGLHVTVNAARGRSRSRSRSMRGACTRTIARLVPMIIHSMRDQTDITRSGPCGELTGEEVVMIQAMRSRGRIALPWRGE